MNDKFLKSYRIAPRPTFAEALREHLEVQDGKTSRLGHLRLCHVAPGVMTLVLTFALLSSPAARAQVQSWVGQVGGVLFTTTSDYPGGDGPVTVAPSDEMSLEEARAVLPFNIDLPAWVPEGYMLEETVRIMYFDDSVGRVFIRWRAPRASLELEIVDLPRGDSRWLVGPGSIREVLVNGEPAALVRGGWRSETKRWDNPAILHLYVTHEGQTYVFSAMETHISVDELIRVAELLP